MTKMALAIPRQAPHWTGFGVGSVGGYIAWYTVL